MDTSIPETFLGTDIFVGLNNGRLCGFYVWEVSVHSPRQQFFLTHATSKICILEDLNTGWPRFIRRMILSDVNIEHYETTQPIADITNIVVGSREEMFRVFDSEYTVQPPPVGVSLTVTFNDNLSSETKDEICSKLASALRALKSRISRICGINELERRTQSH